MKLIHQLERKLSWRKKATSANVTNSNHHHVNKWDKTRACKSKSTNAAIKVNDNEFSQYIRFSNPLKPVPAETVPKSFEIVNIRTYSPLQQTSVSAPTTPTSPLPTVGFHTPNVNYRSTSPGCEEVHDAHIYDQIGNNVPLSSSSSSSTSPMVEQLSSISRVKCDILGPTTVTSSCRRNRIKTNPWFKSPWTNRKQVPLSTNCYSNLENSYENLENDYETIERLNCRQKPIPPIRKSSAKHAPLSEISHNHNRPKSLSTIKNGYATFSKGRLPPHLDQYPKSALSSPGDQPPINIVPTPEFVSQSHRICNEISNYFKPNCSPPLKRENVQCKSTLMPSGFDQSSLNKFDSMETIDLTPDMNANFGPTLSEWSLHENPSQENDIDRAISTSTSSDDSTEQSQSRSSRRFETFSRASKRKRPESTYSTKQSKKVDKLKLQLKDVVHAAMLEAKKDDSK
ncbi:hypothetical protein BLOT_006984 [Blomia tropicalis]|nr:hypothetical protein BLOT_006984 [Blomia tropicalis]